jgi:hypothetical protein
MSYEPITINIQMLPKTIRCIDRLREEINSPSFSDTIKCAVDVFDLLVQSVRKGDRILIEDKNGKQTKITLHGVAKDKT